MSVLRADRRYFSRLHHVAADALPDSKNLFRMAANKNITKNLFRMAANKKHNIKHF